jgi:CRISPR-associated protein Cas2
MTIIILEKVPSTLKGELSKWLIEIATGVFVGKTSALVREKLWEKCIDKCNDGRVTMAWKTNNEQGFDFKNHNEQRMIPIDIEGIKLILKPSKV